MVSCILSKFYIKPQQFCRFDDRSKCCILSKFYIKPQHECPSPMAFPGCILSKFYIKPQHAAKNNMNLRVVSYRNSTSNHNIVRARMSTTRLYLIEILHQTTTFDFRPKASPSCILSKFYIKPQLRLERELAYCVVSYRNSTSNHNSAEARLSLLKLYLIEILHQTTTSLLVLIVSVLLYLIEILHQTTT